MNARGYFGIGVLGVTKPMNVGNLVRTAHAFGARFVFLVDPHVSMREIGVSDTSAASGSMPFYTFDTMAQFALPHRCRLVGIEFLEDAIDLPSFHHPPQAAYLLGPELDSLGPDVLARCDHVIRIPTRFCVNVATAGAMVMYDRILQAGRFEPRPVRPGGPSDGRALTGGRPGMVDPARVPRD